MTFAFEADPSALIMPPTAGQWAKAHRGYTVTALVMLVALVVSFGAMFTYPLRQQELATARRAFTAETNRLILVQASFATVKSTYMAEQKTGDDTHKSAVADLHVRRSLFTSPAVTALKTANTKLIAALAATPGPSITAGSSANPSGTIGGFRAAASDLSSKVLDVQASAVTTKKVTAAINRTRDDTITAMVNLGASAGNTGPGILEADTLAAPDAQQAFTAALTEVKTLASKGSTSMTATDIAALSAAITTYDTAGKTLEASQKTGVADLKVSQARETAKQKADAAEKKAEAAAKAKAAANPTPTVTTAPPVVASPSASPTAPPSPAATSSPPAKPTVNTSGTYQASCTPGNVAFTEQAANGDTVSLSPPYAFTYTLTKTASDWTVTVFRCAA